MEKEITDFIENKNKPQLLITTSDQLNKINSKNILKSFTPRGLVSKETKKILIVSNADQKKSITKPINDSADNSNKKVID